MHVFSHLNAYVFLRVKYLISRVQRLLLSTSGGTEKKNEEEGNRVTCQCKCRDDSPATRLCHVSSIQIYKAENLITWSGGNFKLQTPIDVLTSSKQTCTVWITKIVRAADKTHRDERNFSDYESWLMNLSEKSRIKFATEMNDDFNLEWKAQIRDCAHGMVVDLLFFGGILQMSWFFPKWCVYTQIYDVCAHT